MLRAGDFNSTDIPMICQIAIVCFLVSPSDLHIVLTYLMSKLGDSSYGLYRENSFLVNEPLLHGIKYHQGKPKYHHVGIFFSSNFFSFTQNLSSGIENYN